MKVLDLGCSLSHVFEGWFASEEDFQSQMARGLLACPVCGDKTVHKRLSAPRLNLSERSAPSETKDVRVSPEVVPAEPVAEWQAAWMRVLREVVSKTEDVGASFASEARAMHHGDVPARPIRGQATLQETVELLEEGVDVLPLPQLPVLKEPLQ